MTASDPNAPSSNDTNAPDETEAPSEGLDRGDQIDDIDQLLDELRAEISRLKADRARAQSKTWVQRHPYLAIMGATGLGAVAGYGVSTALQPAPRPPLTDRARRRLRRLTEDAHNVAGKLREGVQRQAKEAGDQVRERASDVGQRLADDAQNLGAAARAEAEELAASASEGAQKASGDASQALREATNRLVTRLRKQNGASKATVQNIINRIRETGSEAEESSGGRLRSSLLSVAGVAVVAYLLRRLL